MDAGSKPEGDDRPTRSPSGRFAELSDAGCRQLLSSESIGRVGWPSRDGQMILPVSYLYQDDMIIFRTSAYGVLAELVTPTKVAFEVDVLDPVERTGRNVVAQGVSRAAPDKNWAPRWRMDDVVPWAGGARHLFIAIEIKKLSGRSISKAG
ncbi:MAG TPA: pyridoxamine 5'-phosphate oxidase family protein [Microlunatus sp.]